MSFNWNSAAEDAIAGALGMVPEVGSLLSALVEIFWPQSEEDIWAEIEKQVEQLINQQISQLVQEQVQNSLTGLQNNLGDYLDALPTNDLPNISATWIATDGDFDQQLPSFQAAGYEVLLLPLFAQFANMHLTLLRDGVLYGETWGWNADYRQTIVTKLQQSIASYSAYAQKIYQQGYQNTVNSTGANNHECQPFRSVNAYRRQMTLGVLDFAALWPYMDPIKYPNPVNVYLSREIYSDPVGTCDNSGPINLPSPPTLPISQITVWGWDRIDGVQLTYPSGGGPGGVTTTARMGDQGGGSSTPPAGGVFNVASNPVTVAAGLSGDILNAFQFTFKNGSNTGKIAGYYPGGGPFSFGYDNQILSSIHINGVSAYYGSADCAVFGFQYERTEGVSAATLRRFYVSSPTHETLERLARRCVARKAELADLQDMAAAEAWDEQRAAFRRHLASLRDRRPAPLR